MYSQAIFRSCSSVSLSSGEGFSEAWKTVFVVLRLASRYGHEALHAGVNIKASAFIVWFEHLLPKQHFGFILIHFLLVVV